VEEDREKYFVAADLQRQRGVKIGFVSHCLNVRVSVLMQFLLTLKEGYIPDNGNIDGIEPFRYVLGVATL
jgi:hypothetical protein